MRIDKSTEKYEAWLAERIPLIASDLNLKHVLMREAPFPFLRATFYRWAQTFPADCGSAASAPAVLGVGDLHVENFGTWRDIEGRLIWGINDFDEACHVPYTCDLVRLATSANLAIAAEHLRVPAVRASQAILDGYNAGLRTGGRAFVLAEHHPALRQMAVERLKQPELFWEKLNALPTWRGKIPPSAAKALRRMMPDQNLPARVVHRLAGMGSLGRRRFVALADWHNGSIAREVKELTESAWHWFVEGGSKSEILYQDALNCARRCPDPFVKRKGRWIVRRLAPDCSRIELSSLPAKHDSVRLLESMGFETANVHLGTPKIGLVKADLRKRKAGWLHSASLAMVESVTEDWRKWRKRG